MNYFLWTDEKQQGPYEVKQIMDMLICGTITDQTLCRPEGIGEWNSIRTHFCFPAVGATNKEAGVGERNPVGTKLGRPDEKSAPAASHVEPSGVATALVALAVLELIAAPIAGLVVGFDSAYAGLLIFVGGVTSGLILLGFAKVVEHLYEVAQRLRRIEVVLQRIRNEKDAN